MKISEEQIYKLFHLAHATTFIGSMIGGKSQAERKDFVNSIVNQQSSQVIDTRDFELMKLASDGND
jgi:hypothetical protein